MPPSLLLFCHDSNTALCWVILFYYLNSWLPTRLTLIHTWLRRDSPWLAVCPFPLTHSFSLVYISHVNYLWAPQLNLLYSWCNTELFTCAFGTDPELNSTFYLEVSLIVLDSKPAYTRLNRNGIGKGTSELVGEWDVVTVWSIQDSYGLSKSRILVVLLDNDATLPELG